MRLTLSAALLIAPLLAGANGGPVASSRPSPAGGIGPVDESRVSLTSERLTISLAESGTSCDVRADYVLSNRGDPVRVKYGVPLLATRPFDSEAQISTTALELAASSIEITLAGRSVPCQLEGARRQGPSPGIEGWCTADLEIPAGESIPLRLRYVGWFGFVDWESTESAFQRFEPRTFRYWLAPAGHWAGRPSLEIVIDTGRWGELFTVAKPAGFERDGARLVLSMREADLKALSVIEGTLDAAQHLGSPARTRASAAPGTTVSAAKPLARQGRATYDASNLLDGDPATAWCTASSPAWVELRAPVSKACWIEYVLVPGYAKDERTWRANNRITRVRLGACRPEGPSVVLELEDTSRFDGSAVTLPIYPRDVHAAIHDGQCARLQVEAIDPGPTGDTCISEFKPVLSCN